MWVKEIFFTGFNPILKAFIQWNLDCFFVALLEIKLLISEDLFGSKDKVTSLKKNLWLKMIEKGSSILHPFLLTVGWFYFLISIRMEKNK